MLLIWVIMKTSPDSIYFGLEYWRKFPRGFAKPQSRTKDTSTGMYIWVLDRIMILNNMVSQKGEGPSWRGKDPKISSDVSINGAWIDHLKNSFVLFLKLFLSYTQKYKRHKYC